MTISKAVPTALALVATMLLAPALAGAGGTTQLSAKLKANEEVPGPGEKGGSGEIFVTVKPKKEKLCFQLEFRKIGPPKAGHIHKGVDGEAGPVKVTLFEDSAGLPGPTAEDCVKNLRKRLLRKVAKSPQRFYVNLHNEEFPDGAIRGQLEPAL